MRNYVLKEYETFEVGYSGLGNWKWKIKRGKQESLTPALKV